MDDIEMTMREKDLIIPDGATTIAYGQRGLNWKGVIRYKLERWYDNRYLDRFLSETLKKKACYYGPFVGEFGHFLLHNLPFLTYLHRNGVKIHYCGMELHRPFLVDESGNSIIHEYTALRDFFSESKPSANHVILPDDVEEVVQKFKSKARASGLPFLDISRKDMYWFTFRNWQLNGKQSKYRIANEPRVSSRKSVVIFPRKKGGDFTPNNGGPWDYAELARKVSPYFDDVYLVGHPTLSADVEVGGNIQLKVSADNSETIKYCAQADLIITQHSGAVHIGAYVDTPVLIIFNGQPPIKGLIDTIRFRKNIAKHPLNYAFDLDEIVTFVGTL